MAGSSKGKAEAKKGKEPKPEEDDILEDELGDDEEEDGEDGDEGEEEDGAEVPEPAAKKGKAKAEDKGGVIFVNREKLARARDILLLISGKRAARETSEIERKEHYAQQLAARGVKATDPGAERAMYEILGGLVRTEAEQAVVDVKAAEMKKKLKKKKVA